MLSFLYGCGNRFGGRVDYIGYEVRLRVGFVAWSADGFVEECWFF